MDGSIIVYILNNSNNPKSARIQKIKELFSNSIFQIFIVNPSPPNGWYNLSPTSLSTEQIIEFYQVQWCLNESLNKFSTHNIIIIKENSVSNVDSKIIAQIVIDNVKIENFDISYLCKWQDRCDLYADKV